MPFDGHTFGTPAAEHNHILDEMKRVLDERGWCKFTTLDSTGRICLLGAYHAVTVGKPNIGRPPTGPVWNSLVAAASKNNPVGFNNAATTTRADIDRLIEEARL